MNESVIQKLIQVGQMLERGEIEQSGAEIDAKYYLEQYVALRQSPVNSSVLEQIRQAFADYYISEGCACCRNEGMHTKAEKRLAELLKPDEYEDGSGYNWELYASTDG